MTNQPDEFELNLPLEVVDQVFDDSDNLGNSHDLDAEADDQSYVNPAHVIRDCLKATYDVNSIDDILIFIEKTAREIKSSWELNEKINKIIHYAFQYDEVDNLWQGIKVDWQKYYKKFYPQWEKAIKKQKEQDAEKEQTEAKDAQSDSLESVDNIEKNSDDYERVFLKERPQQFETDTPHPLEEDDMNVLNEWFFKQLGLEDRSLLLTVALFEGIDRRYVNILAKHVANKLKPEPDEEKGVSHEK